jgi:N-acetylneuraminic acid mutarotase
MLVNRIQQDLKESPTARCGHRMVYFKEKIYLHGGNTFLLDQVKSTTELWCFDTITLTWNLIDNSSHFYSNYGFGFSMIVYKDQIYTFSDSILNKYNFENWEIVKTKNQTSPVYCHSCVIYEDNLIIFGGKSRENFQILNETNVYNFKENSWKLIVIPKQNFIPMARYFHSAIIHKHFMYIYGGFNGISHFGDVCRYDTIQNKWKLINFAPNEILNRRSHSASRIQSKMFIFGGYDGKSFLNDLWCFCLEEECWKEIKIHNPPSIRRFHSECEINCGFYIFGGIQDIHRNMLGDLVKFEIQIPSFKENLFSNFNFHDCFIHI